MSDEITFTKKTRAYQWRSHMEKEENSAIVTDIRALIASFIYSINLVIWGMYKYPC